MGTVGVPVEPMQWAGKDDEVFRENWVWDSRSKSPEVVLSRDSNAAYFHIDPAVGSQGAAAVRGNRGFTEGEHFWEIHMMEPAYGTSVMIGVGTKDTLLHTTDYQYINLIGLDNKSWGLCYKGTLWHNGVCKKYCDPFFQSVIGVHLDLYRGTLTYYNNGHSLGVAFTGLDLVKEELFPIISSTSELTEMEVGSRTCRYLSLQEKCLLQISKSLHDRSQVNELPLPPLFKRRIYELK